ncbi:MAG TPA: DUF6221 family protein [Trebonia sp.]|jgi:hypothetical protein
MTIPEARKTEYRKWLIEFINARLAEEEATARAAGGGTWRTGCYCEGPCTGWGGGCCRVEGDDIKIYDEGGHDASQADHIARHDPARVLREIEAKRAILARYEDCLDRMENLEFSAMAAREGLAEYEDSVLPNMAGAWSDHADYRQE